ncbi:hypothetical protein DV515_00002540 [Chloebia gouldiae]|uniref:Uncharacterized protein n=1 Tax=Chloebia gouldiae TaxID=44316 RepID=A0A3L8SY47_CHLGU|nr:hypothetical protein DV515_00002540 [Chloebia gouldiae]
MSKGQRSYQEEVAMSQPEEVNDRVEGAVDAGQHKANLWGIHELVAQEVQEDEDTERHSENEEEEDGEHDDGEESACLEGLGAALDPQEEGEAEEQHEGCTDKEIQGSNGDEQALADPARGANGAQSISQSVQQQGQGPEQAGHHGRQVLWAVCPAPDGRQHGQAALNADGCQQVQARAIHEEIQEEEYPELHPHVELHQVLHSLHSDAQQVSEVSSRQVQDVDSEVVPANAEAQVPQDQAVPYHPTGSTQQAEALHELEDSVGWLGLSHSPALTLPPPCSLSPNKVTHYFCYIHPLLPLACADTHTKGLATVANSGVRSVSCFLLLVMS